MAFGKLKNKVKSGGEALFYVVPVLLIFGLIYLCSLTFRYVEGDDAASVAFHAFGRNFNLQPPYSPYHGMMDVFLYLLPADELIVRHITVGITALSSIVFILLVIDLIKGWLPNLQGFRIALTAVIILLCTPEIFYLSLFYTPSLTAMCFILIAHKLIKSVTTLQNGLVSFNAYNSGIFTLSIVMFGAGTACRWDIGAYLIVIVADLIFNKRSSEKYINTEHQFDSFGINLEDDRILNYKRIKLAVLFVIGAFSASVFAIFLSGYGSTAVFDTLKLAGREISSQDSVFSTIGAYQTFFTPAFLAFFLTGFIYFIVRQKSSAVFVLVTALPFLIYAFSREPKMILPAVPSLFLAAAAGINFIWFEISKKYLVLSRALAVITIALPWLVGIQFISPNTSWGPGFEIKTLDKSENSDDGKNASGKAQGQKLSLSNFKIVFGSGFAVPTPEGARPIGGHFYTLIGGQWRSLLEKFDQERVLVLQEADLRDANILQDSGNSYLVTKLLEMGYYTDNPHEIFSAEGIDERIFSKGNEKIHLQALQKRSMLFDKKTINDLVRYNKEIILYSGYSSAIKKLKDTAPNAVQILGPLSAVINLEEFLKSDKLEQ